MANIENLRARIRKLYEQEVGPLSERNAQIPSPPITFPDPAVTDSEGYIPPRLNPRTNVYYGFSDSRHYLDRPWERLQRGQGT